MDTDNTPIETTEEVVVETEANPVENTAVEPAVTEQVSEDNSLDINFDDFAPEEYMPQQQPVANDDIVEQIAARLANRLQPAPSQVVEPAYEQQANQDVVTKAELQAMFAQMQEQQEAQRMIQNTIAEATKVQNNYVEKLTQTLSNNGIDLIADEALKVSCDLLYRQMYEQKVKQLGRSAPVLTPAETHELVQEHFKTFNKIFLQNKIQKKPQANQNLSPAGNAAPHQGQTAKTPDEFAQFMEKKKNGTVTMSDLANLLARPTQKK